MLEGLVEFDKWNRQAICAVFALFGIPDSYADFGCGTGAMVDIARRLGAEAMGVDVNPGPDMLQWDLRTHFDAGRTFDLVTSIETGEHIDPDCAGTFVDTVARHTSPSGIVIFTAALPGQIGDGHVNCQPPTYWRGLFYDRGLDYRKDMTVSLTALWNVTTGPMMHLSANLQCFSRYG